MKSMKRTIQAPSALLAIALVLCAPLAARAATSHATPGFNLFSVEQDIEIGRQSAAEAERELPLLNDRNVDRYLNEIIRKLAEQAPGARYPYAIKAVNASEINAFSLPGGPMYVNRGLFEAARSEAELAGVLAHEMSHVALRHGTHQASKAYLSQAGLGILGGLLGKNGGNTTRDRERDRRRGVEHGLPQVQPRRRIPGRPDGSGDHGLCRIRPSGHGQLLRAPPQRAGP